jgi:hypothetical protein
MARRGRPKQYVEDRVTTAIRVPVTLHERLQQEAERRDTSINHLMVRAAAYYLDHHLPPLGPADSESESSASAGAERLAG